MNTSSLAQQRCFNHILREAVGLCPQCGHFYCRECITEHDDRIICAACLRLAAEAAAPRRGRIGWIGSVVSCGFGIVLLWLFFYSCGSLLVQIPAKFHEGTLWIDRWFQP